MNAEMGSRLVEERERLGLSQQHFFNACGVSKTAQFRFERGENIPGGAYLIAADALGVDVLYVLTGRRGRPIASNTASAKKGSVAVAGANNSVTVTKQTARRKK